MTELYPVGFEPDHNEILKCKESQNVKYDVPGTRLTFNEWKGKDMINDWRKIPIKYNGNAMFAELAIALKLLEAGWPARWVEVYYLDNGKPYYLLNWNDVKPFNQTSFPLDEKRLRLMESIEASCVKRNTKPRRSPYAGAWDILTWKDDRILIMESKRKGRDSINWNQIAWYEGAIDACLNRNNFLVVQWDFETDGRIYVP